MGKHKTRTKRKGNNKTKKRGGTAFGIVPITTYNDKNEMIEFVVQDQLDNAAYVARNRVYPTNTFSKWFDFDYNNVYDKTYNFFNMKPIVTNNRAMKIGINTESDMQKIDVLNKIIRKYNNMNSVYQRKKRVGGMMRGGGAVQGGIEVDKSRLFQSLSSQELKIADQLVDSGIFSKVLATVIPKELPSRVEQEYNVLTRENDVLSKQIEAIKQKQVAEIKKENIEKTMDELHNFESLSKAEKNAHVLNNATLLASIVQEHLTKNNEVSQVKTVPIQPSGLSSTSAGHVSTSSTSAVSTSSTPHSLSTTSSSRPHAVLAELSQVIAKRNAANTGAANTFPISNTAATTVSNLAATTVSNLAATTVSNLAATTGSNLAATTGSNLAATTGSNLAATPANTGAAFKGSPTVTQPQIQVIASTPIVSSASTTASTIPLTPVQQQEKNLKEREDKKQEELKKKFYNDPEYQKLILSQFVKTVGTETISTLPQKLTEDEILQEMNYLSSLPLASPTQENKYDALRKQITTTPSYIAKQKKEQEDFLANIKPWCEYSLKEMKTFFPPLQYQKANAEGYSNDTTINYSKDLSTRLYKNRYCFKPFYYDEKTFSKTNKVDLNNCRPFDLDFIETAALYTNMPAQFESDQDPYPKAKWKQSVEDHLKKLFKEKNTQHDQAYTDQVGMFNFDTGVLLSKIDAETQAKLLKLEKNELPQFANPPPSKAKANPAKAKTFVVSNKWIPVVGEEVTYTNQNQNMGKYFIKRITPLKGDMFYTYTLGLDADNDNGIIDDVVLTQIKKIDASSLFVKHIANRHINTTYDSDLVVQAKKLSDYNETTKLNELIMKFRELDNLIREIEENANISDEAEKIKIVEERFKNSVDVTSVSPLKLNSKEIDAYIRYWKYNKIKGEKLSNTTTSNEEIQTKFGFSPGFVQNYDKTMVSTTLPPPPPPPSTTLTHEQLEKYNKMIKMLPEGAVRQKMMTDGISPDNIDAFFNQKQSV